jgi:hypothetical protein
MTFGFVEIHTCTSCNTAGINMSNVVQYLLCYGSNIYVWVFEHILWLHDLHFYVRPNKKAKAHYWAEMGYVFMPTSSEKVLILLRQTRSGCQHLCLSFLELCTFVIKCNFLRQWTYFVNISTHLQNFLPVHLKHIST